MAVTIAELIGKKDEIRNKKNALYELETSIGDIVAKLPTSSTVADAWAMSNTMEGNKFLLFNCIIDPNLKDKQLQEAYDCLEPTDIVPAIFQVGEISRIASVLMERAGFGGDINYKIHKEVKNS